MAMSSVTGCPMYLTPQKHWPQGLREQYFGNRTVFGMLRDPYERMVAIFRGETGEDYGGLYPDFFPTCDVSGAVKFMMRRYLRGDKYSNGCVFIPQAEYFEGAHGITLPVDNRRFPDSMNKVYKAHGYNNTLISTPDILHVTACPDTWAADLDAEARQLVRQVYARDFELLCTHFGHCDSEESTCIRGVPDMCPKSVKG